MSTERKERAERARRRIWELARSQLGVFSRHQAVAAGVSGGAIAREVRRGAWKRVLPGIYRAASTPVSGRQMLLAACLWGGDGAVVSHATAARLHGLEGLRPRGAREPVEITVALNRRPRAPGIVVHRSRTLGDAERRAIDGIPTTTLARTLVDLAPRLDESRLGIAVDSGIARHPNTDVRALRRALRRPGARWRPGARVLGRVLRQRAPDDVHLDSALERRFAAALRGAGLPRPTAHFDVVERGRHVAQLDFAYPHHRLGIQVNGSGIHRRYAVWERDQRQLSELAALGWRIVHVTWSQLEASDDAVIDRVKRALSAAVA